MSATEHCRSCGIDIAPGTLLCDACKEGAKSYAQAPASTVPDYSHWVLAVAGLVLGGFGFAFAIGGLGDSSYAIRNALLCFGFGWLTTILALLSGFMLKPRRMGLPLLAGFVNLLPVVLLGLLALAFSGKHH